MSSPTAKLTIPALLAIFLAGCATRPPIRNEYPMGEKAPLGGLTYTVVETTWKTQLGQTFNIRVPQRRFLEITLSVTNGGGKELSIPLMQIEDSNGKMYLESDDGTGVDNWFGLLRNLKPAETQQGRLLFDVPLTSYRLKVTDAGEPGAEQFSYITIPLRLDVDQPIRGPDIGTGLK